MWKLFELLLKTVCFILLVLDSFQWISNPKFTMTSHIRFYHCILIIFICTRFSSFCYHTFAGFVVVVVGFLFRSIAITNIYNSKLFYSFIRIKLPATKTLRKNWRKWHTRSVYTLLNMCMRLHIWKVTNWREWSIYYKYSFWYCGQMYYVQCVGDCSILRVTIDIYFRLAMWFACGCTTISSKLMVLAEDFTALQQVHRNTCQFKYSTNWNK